MGIRAWLAIWFFLCVPEAVAGGACAPVDLRAKIGPPLHQGESGYCFAHSSSTLIQARLGVRVSPMHLAAGYLLATPEELSGSVDSRVKERLTPAFFEMWRKDRTLETGNYDPAKILTDEGLLNTGGDELQTLVVANFLGLCPMERLPTGADVYKSYLESIVTFHRSRAIPPEERERAIGEVQVPEARAMAWSYRHWVESRCGTAFRPARPLLPSALSLAANLKAFRRLEASPLAAARILAAQNRVVQELDRQLDRRNPVAIGYALADLMPETAALLAGGGTDPASLVDHASVIAGRRMVKGRCYYYLRNSFGNDTDGYRAAFQGRLEEGGVWILPEELPSLYSAVWLD